MTKQQQLDILIAAEPVADLVLKHNYLPNGYSSVVNQLNDLHKTVYGKGVMLHCSSCITDMVKRLYNHTKPQLINELTIIQDANGKTKGNRKP